MKKTKLIFLSNIILFFITYNLSAIDNKYVIGCHTGRGLFASFFGAITQINWCKENNKIPVIYWDHKSMYYIPEGFNGSKNVWEYYFHPVSNLRYNVDDQIHISQSAPNGMLINFDNTDNYRKNVNKIIVENIVIKDSITKKINNFFKNKMNGKQNIGIHLRGTDKFHDILPVETLRILEKANSFIGKNTQFFVASDEQRLLDMAKKILKADVVYYECYRSNDGYPIHYNHSNHIISLNEPNLAQRGEDVLVEVQLLSRCDILIHTMSFVSFAAIFFNPFLKSVLLYPDKLLLSQLKFFLKIL